MTEDRERSGLQRLLGRGASKPQAKVKVENLDKPKVRVPAVTTPPKTPASKAAKAVMDAAPKAAPKYEPCTATFDYDVACKVCGAPPHYQCLKSCTRLNSGNPHYHSRFSAETRHPTSNQSQPKGRRGKSGDYILKQQPGDSGFERIGQAELLQDASVQKLLAMLGYMRPGGSKAEELYIKTYIVDPAALTSSVDKYGNRWVWVLDKDDKGKDRAPDILFSSHTDTVHHESGAQRIVVGDGRAWTEEGSCLGGDDTVGNWLMLEMIKARVPGCYVFHRDEETGGSGSDWIAKNRDTRLKKFKAAIALDRKGYHDIITHQGGQRCCSETFSKSLAAILGGKFSSSNGGTFTDTKNYVDHIGECTNLSVGYFNQHGPTEWVDLSFAVRLRDALIAADWSKLEFERKPGERESYSYGSRYGGGYGGYGDAYWDEMFGQGTNDKPAPAKSTPPNPVFKTEQRATRIANIYAGQKRQEAYEQMREMALFVRMWPESVAVFLMEHGFTHDDIATAYEGWDDHLKKNLDEE